MATLKLPSQARLKELFDYNPETGKFIRRIKTGSRAMAGSIAGGLNHYGYRMIHLDGKKYMAHRLAWVYMHGKEPEDQIDHINGKFDDNQMVNLREADNLINSRNAGLKSNNTSGINGVHWHPQTGKWRARIDIKGKGVHLGLFKYQLAAACARWTADIYYEFHENHGRVSA